MQYWVRQQPRAGGLGCWVLVLTGGPREHFFNITINVWGAQNDYIVIVGPKRLAAPLGVALFCFCSGRLFQFVRQTGEGLVVRATSKSGKIWFLPLGVILQHDVKTAKSPEPSPLKVYEKGLLSDTP